jgi:CRISPR/Cas system-associated protein Cas10 (large subunit of type III CRISPR-Cas system)
MRTVSVPPHDERSFDYYCPICGIELAETDHERLDAEYFCPVCATQQRASRIPARLR